MSWFPTIPGWDGIHPAMVHFPVALLLVAPIFLLVSLFARQAWRAWSGAAFVLMALGTLAAWFAVGTGHAAGQLVDKSPDLANALARHEALGLMTRNLFTSLTALFALLLLLPALTKRSPSPPLRISLAALFLVVYVGGTTVLANTANHGGRLVHEYGVRAMIDKPVHEALPAQASAMGAANRAGGEGE